MARKTKPLWSYLLLGLIIGPVGGIAYQSAQSMWAPVLVGIVFATIFGLITSSRR